MASFDNALTRRSALALAAGAMIAGRDLAAAQAPEVRLNRKGLELTFSDEFDTLAYDADADLPLNGKWQSWFNHGGKDNYYARHLHQTAEQQYYVDAYILDKLCKDVPGYMTYNPFSLVDGPDGGKALRITARRMSLPMVRALRDRLGLAQGIKRIIATNYWSSGCLTTYDGFKQKYGLFETRVKISSVIGSWPAFWLLPADRGYSAWPPEIDIFDNYPQRGNRNLERWNVGGVVAKGSAPGAGYGPKDANFDGKAMPYPVRDHWRTIGVEWDPKNLIYYADDVEFYRYPTPPSFNENMFINLNLAIVGNQNAWASPPGPAASKIALDIDWVRVWQR